MSARGRQPAGKRPIRTNIRPPKPTVQTGERELADEQLDEALRQTFPASDALSIVQSARRS
jgi:hypothetical protein